VQDRLESWFTNSGPDKDSDKRQRAAVVAFAKAHGFVIVEEFADVVSGADPIDERSGFARMLERIAGNGVRTILIESPDRFARDLTVQLTGHDKLKALGVSLIPTTLLERHVLNGLVDAPWVRTDDPESDDDDGFFAALQELVAYAFEESARIKKEGRR
jgi:Resolvase, N terminal domain